jgi:hypothetical protein
MSVTVDATPKSATANSYVDVSTADTYLTARLNAGAWTRASADDRARALLMATARLETEGWLGLRTTGTQALSWPRQDIDDDAGGVYDSDTIPVPLQHACAELALALLNAGSTDLLADTGLEQFSQATAGSQAVTLNPNFKAGQLPATVSRLVSRFKSAASGFRISRG